MSFGVKQERRDQDFADSFIMYGKKAEGDMRAYPFLLSSDGKLQVDTEISLDGNLVIDNIAVYATDVSDSTTALHGLVDAQGHVQVDVLSGAGVTEYNEGEATPATISGIANVMERDDIIGALTPTEGQWAAFRCSAEGALWVQDFNSDAILADTAAMVVDLAAIEVLLGTIDSDTSDIKTAVEIIDNAISGSEMQVDVVTLPATAADANYFNAIVDSADVSSAVSVQVATADKKIYITSFCISVDTAGSYWLQDEDDNQVSAKFYLAANGGVVMNFTNENPLVLDTVNKALEVKGSVSGNVGVTCSGYIV